MHFINNQVRNLQISVNNPVAFEIIIILSERIDQRLSDLQPAKEESKLDGVLSDKLKI